MIGTEAAGVRTYGWFMTSIFWLSKGFEVALTTTKMLLIRVPMRYVVTVMSPWALAVSEVSA